MKKRLSLFLLTCLLLPLGVCACSDKPETPVPPETLTIAGEDISKFTIVYTPAYSEEFLAEFEDFLGYDFEHNLETANELQKLLKETFGVTLPVVKAGTETDGHEILVGVRKEDALADDAYAIRAEGKKLIVTGGSYGAVYHALDAFKKAFAETTVADMVWEDGFLLSGRASMKRIACIGDSLTEGSIGGHVTPELAYPAALQRFLWRDYNVYNYGLGGTSLINSSANPYMSSRQYNDCLTSGMQYDLILVMLGTNDSKVVGDTWTDAANTEFMSCAKTLFASLKEKSPEARFAYMNCPVKFTEAGYANAYMLPVQKEAATLLAKEGYDITHYDMRAYTTEVLTKDNFPKDGLHPNYDGYYKIAEGVCDLVYHLAEGDENDALDYIIPLE